MRHLLLCTLGASWAVIPEVYAFLASERLPLYRHHPQASQLAALVAEHGLAAPDEIWLLTTQGAPTQTGLTRFREWLAALAAPPVVRIWQAAETDQLATQTECARMRELIARACLKASEYAAGGQVVLSLAGGRKTMSADMQWAGGIFGCAALLHVIGIDPLPPRLREAMPALLTAPLPEELAAYVTPLITGQARRSDWLDITLDGIGPIDSASYPVPWPAAGTCAVFEDPPRLVMELQQRERASNQLLGNYLIEISRDEHHENWRSLYRLAPRRINQLRATPLTTHHRDWLIRLPKADLHRHLGGCLDLAAQRLVAQAIWDALSPDERQGTARHCESLLTQRHWDWQWPTHLKARGVRSHHAAYLLLHLDDARLRQQLWGCTEPRVALKTRHPHGFAAYERPGELSGSALLSHPAAIAPYATAIVEQAVAEGLAYVELRGSPQKYQQDGLAFLERFYTALQTALLALPAMQRPWVRFLIIADRRADRAALQKTICDAVAAKARWPDFVVGLDLAGDEQHTAPAAIADVFQPAFEYCLPLTIHAGEGEEATAIWQAAYHLHADRIGHGLSLHDHPSLAQRFRDRNICLELCPSSNREVVGFYDPDEPASHACPRYPLWSLWQQGLPLTVCTDNPGISRTTLADEYLAAARMSDGNISQWDALAMIKQGFVHGFLNERDKESMMKTIDARMRYLLIR